MRSPTLSRAVNNNASSSCVNFLVRVNPLDGGGGAVSK
jgi:hypothetical protein